MSKYDPLQNFLARRAGSVTTVLLDEITAMVPGGLPNSAFKYEAWWNNDDDSHSHCRSWGNAGFYARPDLARKRVRFEPR